MSRIFFCKTVEAFKVLLIEESKKKLTEWALRCIFSEVISGS